MDEEQAAVPPDIGESSQQNSTLGDNVVQSSHVNTDDINSPELDVPNSTTTSPPLSTNLWNGGLNTETKEVTSTTFANEIYKI